MNLSFILGPYGRALLSFDVEGVLEQYFLTPANLNKNTGADDDNYNDYHDNDKFPGVDLMTAF